MEIKSKLEHVTTKVEQLGQKFDDFSTVKGHTNPFDLQPNAFLEQNNQRI
jgi:hypothetical protein